jgi:hypothetical protein
MTSFSSVADSLVGPMAQIPSLLSVTALPSGASGSVMKSPHCLSHSGNWGLSRW